jgi:hypothetical protein
MFTISLSGIDGNCGWNKWRERERKMKGTTEGGFSRPHRHFVKKRKKRKP